jgi:hypothetical protein
MPKKKTTVLHSAQCLLIKLKLLAKLFLPTRGLLAMVLSIFDIWESKCLIMFYLLWR